MQAARAAEANSVKRLRVLPTFDRHDASADSMLSFATRTTPRARALGVSVVSLKRDIWWRASTEEPRALLVEPHLAA